MIEHIVYLCKEVLEDSGLYICMTSINGPPSYKDYSLRIHHYHDKQSPNYYICTARFYDDKMAIIWPASDTFHKITNGRILTHAFYCDPDFFEQLLLIVWNVHEYQR